MLISQLLIEDELNILHLARPSLCAALLALQQRNELRGA